MTISKKWKIQLKIILCMKSSVWVAVWPAGHIASWRASSWFDKGRSVSQLTHTHTARTQRNTMRYAMRVSGKSNVENRIHAAGFTFYGRFPYIPFIQTAQTFHPRKHPRHAAHAKQERNIVYPNPDPLWHVVVVDSVFPARAQGLAFSNITSPGRNRKNAAPCSCALCGHGIRVRHSTMLISPI